MISNPANKRLRFSSQPGFRVNNPTLPMTRRPEEINAGSVLQKNHSLPIIVTRYFTDVNGTIISKADAGLVAAGMAIDYPVFLLGEFDREGGYKTGLSILSPAPPAKPYTSFINGVTGTSQNICTPFSPFNTIQAQLTPGDLCMVYTDNVAAPNYFAWIVQTNNYAPLSSIITNLKTEQKDRRLGPLLCYEINWYATESQWDKAINFVQFDNLGTWENNPVQPYIFKTPFNIQQGFITVSCAFNMNQFMQLSTVFEIDTDSMSFNFNIKKID